MKYVSYKGIKKVRNWAGLLCLVVIALSAGKLYYDYSKITLYNKGEGLFKLGKVVQAETYFSKARNLKYFNYNNEKISDRLIDLRDVTESKAFESDLLSKLKKAHNSKNVEALISLYKEYTEKYDNISSKGKEAQSVFEEISRDNKIDSVFEDYFESAKTALRSAADANIKNRKFTDEKFMDLAAGIPDKFYGGKDKKAAELGNLIKDYENKKIDILVKDNKVMDTIDEAEKVIAYCKLNSMDYGWISGKMESVWSDAVQNDIKKSDYDLLYQHYDHYKSFIKDYKVNSKVPNIVNTKINEDRAKANSYAGNGKYNEAIELYGRIGKFVDTKKDINNVKLKQIESSPSIALNQVFGSQSYKNVILCKNQWGMPVNVIGYSSTSIYFVGISSDLGYISAQYAPFNNKDSMRSLKMLNELNYDNSPVILAEGLSTLRKSEYAGLAIADGKFKEVFRLEADGLTAENNSLLVDNPVGTGEGRQCYFRLNNGRYTFLDVKKDYIDISLRELKRHKNEMVRFRCSMSKYLSNPSSALVTDGTDYVLLNNLKQVNRNEFYVIGRYIGESVATKDGKAINVPAVNVIEIQY